MTVLALNIFTALERLNRPLWQRWGGALLGGVVAALVVPGLSILLGTGFSPVQVALAFLLAFLIGSAGAGLSRVARILGLLFWGAGGISLPFSSILLFGGNADKGHLPVYLALSAGGVALVFVLRAWHQGDLSLRTVVWAAMIGMTTVSIVFSLMAAFMYLIAFFGAEV